MTSILWTRPVTYNSAGRIADHNFLSANWSIYKSCIHSIAVHRFAGWSKKVATASATARASHWAVVTSPHLTSRKSNSNFSTTEMSIFNYPVARRDEDVVEDLHGQKVKVWCCATRTCRSHEVIWIDRLRIPIVGWKILIRLKHRNLWGSRIALQHHLLKKVLWRLALKLVSLNYGTSQSTLVLLDTAIITFSTRILDCKIKGKNICSFNKLFTIFY